MFGTLVIQLPSDYKGGQLVVHHQGEKKTFDFSDNRCYTYYAAFYADCQHEISEVAEGYRLCLIYNLVSRAAQAVPPAIPSEDNSDAVAEVVKIISEWTADEKGPSITVHRLDHKYCESSLSFNTLKNKDRAVADVLLKARKQVNFDLYLTIVQKNEQWNGISNSATHPCNYCDGSCGDYILDELVSSNLRVSGSITPSGKKLKEYEIATEDLEQLMTTGDDAEADYKEFAEATGNEGATIDKTYFRTFLLVRPHNLAVLGLDGMIERLEEAIDDTPKDSTKWKQWEELAESLVAKTEKKSPSRLCIGLMLRCLCVSKNAELADTFLVNISASGSCSSYYLNHCSDMVLRACNVLGWSALKSGLYEVFKSRSINCSSELLLKLIGDEQAVMTPEQQEVCRQLANIVYNNVLQQEDEEQYCDYKYTTSKETVCLMFKILTILHLNIKLESLLEFFFHQKNRFPLVSVLIPVAKELHQQGMDKDGILLSRCIKALDDQISSTSVPCEPTNWSHGITLKCTCNDCKKLQAFLVHPNQTQFVIDGDYRARDHLERELRTSCPQFEDFDISTMQVVLTKTHRTFETKLQEYQDNLKTLDVLRQLSQSAADSGEEHSAKHRKLDM